MQRKNLKAVIEFMILMLYNVSRTGQANMSCIEKECNE